MFAEKWSNVLVNIGYPSNDIFPKLIVLHKSATDKLVPG
jgi:hypothetical protein